MRAAKFLTLSFARLIFEMNSPNRNDPCPCGSGKKYKKCCLGKPAATHIFSPRAETSVNHSVNASNVAPPSELLMRGVALHQAGMLNEAEASYRALLARNPHDCDALHYLGLIALQRGLHQEAIYLIESAIRINRAIPAFHCNLGNAYKELGQLDSAIAAFREAVRLDPRFGVAYSNLGNTFLDKGKLDDAVLCYRKAIALIPDFAEAHKNLGSTLREQGKLDEALACYRRAQSLNPNDGLKVASLLMLPPIMGTQAEMLENRARFEHNLDHLLAEGITLTDPSKEFGATNFYLAYHGLNDRAIQQKTARLYEQACPALLYTAPHCASPSSASNKTRIGFLSKFIYAHSVSLCYGRVVEALAKRDEFEVSLISSHGHQEESARNAYPNFSGTHVHLPNQLDLAREKVAALGLDILVYLDIGMDPLSYFLAFSRLAQVQCVVGGHPVTTGIGNVDYFLSSVLAEPENADAHYSEKLVRLPIRPSYFELPLMPATFKTRKELGLPEDGHLYTCPMKLQKIHPEFDAAITRILQLDPDGYVILFEDETHPTWRGLLEKRMAQTIPDNVRDRVLFLPWINDYSDFLSLNKISDVVLDPFHFGIGTTAIATYSVGTPVVTRPGEFLRGRIGLQFCKLLDVPECVAADTEDYARKALLIASDHALRENIKTRILANNYTLFENMQPIEDLANFFLGIKAQLDAEGIHAERTKEKS